MSGKLRTVRGKVTHREYERLKEIRDAYGFKSIYEIMQCLTRAFINHVDHEVEYPPVDPTNEIDEMFNEFTDAESPV